MNVVLSKAEIDLLWSTKTAQENYVYVCEDGFLYKGQKNGALARVLNTNYDDWVKQRNANQTLPYRNKTIEQGTRQSDGDIADVKVNDSGVTLVEVSKSILPTGGATEAKQDDVIQSLSTYFTEKPGNVVSTGNSTSTLLNSLAVFTGAWEDVSKYDSLVFSCKTDQHGTLLAQFSTDGTNIDSSLSFEVYASVNEVHRLTISKKYFRIVLTNDSASNQTYLRLQVLFGSYSQLTSPSNSVVYDDADAQLVRPLDFNLMVAEGLYYDRTNTIKDGLNLDIDTASVPEDIWTNGSAYTGFVTTAAAAELVVAGADTGRVYYSYMATDTDLDYTFASREITGVGTYSLGHNIWRCNFMYFVASTNVFNVGLMTIRHTATPANVFVTIEPGYSQSYCSAYTVPYNSSIYIDRISGTVRGSTSGTLDGFFYYKPYGESPRLRFPFELQFGSLYFDDIDYLIKIPSRTDIMPRIITSSANNLSAKISYRVIKVK